MGKEKKEKEEKKGTAKAIVITAVITAIVVVALMVGLFFIFKSDSIVGENEEVITLPVDVIYNDSAYVVEGVVFDGAHRNTYNYKKFISNI